MLNTLRLPSPGMAVVCLFFATVLAVGALVPEGLAPLLATTAAFGLVILAGRHLIGFCVAWLLLAGTSLEMTLHDLIDPSAYATTIAVVKAAQFGLAALCVMRYGPRLDPFNPAWAFFAIFTVGVVHGLHPGLTGTASLRSLAGSVAPFAFCFSRLPRDWASTM